MPQEVVNFSAGLGDVALAAVSLGIIDGNEIRTILFDNLGGVDTGSRSYQNGFVAGVLGTMGAGRFTVGPQASEASTASVKPQITAPYKRPSGATTQAQRDSVQGKPCVDCGATTSKQIADHKVPLVKEYYESGTIDTQNMRSLDAVQAQCSTCSARQGAEMSRYSKQQKADRGL